MSPNKKWDSRGISVSFGVGQGGYIPNPVSKSANRSLNDCLLKALGGSPIVRCSIPENIQELQKRAKKTQKQAAQTRKSLEKRVGNIQLIVIVSLLIGLAPILTFAITAINNMKEAYTKNIEQYSARIDELEKKVYGLERKSEYALPSPVESIDGQRAISQDTAENASEQDAVNKKVMGNSTKKD